MGTVGAVKQGDMKKWLNLDPPPTPSRGRPSSTRTSTRYRSPTLAERPKTIDLVAPLCNSRRDQPSQAMPSLERGDLVAFLETGGNLEPIAVRYNAQFPPATVLVCWDQAEVTTVRERLDDVVGRFRVPPRLRAASFHPS